MDAIDGDDDAEQEGLNNTRTWYYVKQEQENIIPFNQRSLSLSETRRKKKALTSTLIIPSIPQDRSWPASPASIVHIRRTTCFFLPLSSSW
jgi:hypothetical protein